MKTWKKIEETKKRASDVQRLKAKNEERLAQELRKKCRDIVVMQINERANETIIPIGSDDAKS